MVSIGAARVVLLLAGLWRAPEETGVRSNLEYDTPQGVVPAMRSQTRRNVIPDLSTGDFDELTNLLAADPMGRGHVWASPINLSQHSALHPVEDMSANMTNFARISTFPPLAAKIMLHPANLDADLAPDHRGAHAEPIGTAPNPHDRLVPESEHLVPLGSLEPPRDAMDDRAFLDPAWPDLPKWVLCLPDFSETDEFSKISCETGQIEFSDETPDDSDVSLHVTPSRASGDHMTGKTTASHRPLDELDLEGACNRRRRPRPVHISRKATNMIHMRTLSKNGNRSGHVTHGPPSIFGNWCPPAIFGLPGFDTFLIWVVTPLLFDLDLALSQFGFPSELDSTLGALPQGTSAFMSDAASTPSTRR